METLHTGSTAPEGLQLREGGKLVGSPHSQKLVTAWPQGGPGGFPEDRV